jgi:hypothetical protein
MTDCWGCRKNAETGLDGFVQADCAHCMAREIAKGPIGQKWEGDPGALRAEIFRVGPHVGGWQKLRTLVWAILKPSA